MDPITTKEAAKAAGYKDASVIRHAIANGELKATKFGHDWMIDRADLDAWMEIKQPGRRKNTGGI